MHSSNKFFFNVPEFQSEQTKITKTLLIQSLQENNFSQQFQVSIPYDSVSRQLDMGQVLHEIFFEILNSNYQYQVFYFSSLNGCFCFGDVYPWTRKFVLGEEFIPKEEIFIAFRKVSLIDGQNPLKQENSLESIVPSQPQQKKKRRINDRTILETLQKVSLWRSKCEQQKITYQEAAKEIDIPKKTLDDYYALIRTGQEYGFDYQKNYYQKIGVLRQFVKEKQKENKNNKEKKSYQSSKGSKSGKMQVVQDEDEQKFEGGERKISIIDKMMLGDGSEEEDEGAGEE